MASKWSKTCAGQDFYLRMAFDGVVLDRQAEAFVQQLRVRGIRP